MVVCIFFGIFGLVTAGVTWWYFHYFHPAPFQPVALSQPESEALQAKLATLQGRLEKSPGTSVSVSSASDPAKTIVLSEREINGWLAAQQDIGDKVRVHLENNLFGATLLLPMDPSLAFVGGKTLRVRVSFNAMLDATHHLVLSLADISVGGIPVPNAWLNGAKGMNLLADNGPGSPNQRFLNQVTAGLRAFQINQGELRLVLND